MILVHYDPFRQVDRVTQPGWEPNSSQPLPVPIDAYRNGDAYVVALDLPGVDPSAIDLTVEKNVLTLKAVRSWNQAEGDQVLVAGRPHGVFIRQLFLGDVLDSDHIDASYD